DQANEHKKGEPRLLCLAVVDETVDQEFDAILRGNGAADGRQNAAKDDSVGIGAAAQIANNEAYRPVGILAQIVHRTSYSPRWGSCGFRLERQDGTSRETRSEGKCFR